MSAELLVSCLVLVFGGFCIGISKRKPLIPDLDRIIQKIKAMEPVIDNWMILRKEVDATIEHLNQRIATLYSRVELFEQLMDEIHSDMETIKSEVKTAWNS